MVVKNQFDPNLLSYLSETLAIEVEVQPSPVQGRLPIILGRKFRLYESSLSGRRVIFAVLGPKAKSTPKELQKQLEVIGRMVSNAAVVILVAPRLKWSMRTRLKEIGVQFVVPDREVFLPNFSHITVDRGFSELSFGDKFTPSAQVIVFGYLLGRTREAVNASELATALHMTPMSAGRGLDQLEELELVQTKKFGRERHFSFTSGTHELFERARKYVISPVKSTKCVVSGFVDDILVIAGASALSELTMLSPPSVPVYAVAANAWKGLVLSRNLIETDLETASLIVETWHYDPASLGEGKLADPLSLYAQFKDDAEPRVRQAAGELLESMRWWQGSTSSKNTWQGTKTSM